MFKLESNIFVVAMVTLPWTSMTIRAPRVVLAMGDSLPRTNSTMSSICRLLRSRYAARPHFACNTCKTAMPPRESRHN